MLVYGDAVRRETPGDKITAIRCLLGEAETLTGIERHGLLVAALIEAGELAQGVTDASFRARGGRDARDPAGDAASALTSCLAALVVASWRNRLSVSLDRQEPEKRLAALGLCALPRLLDLKQPEGFALYAVYPEAYAQAASGLPPGDTTVIGVRSIGTTLAAIVAAALGGGRHLTVRPVGHPFRRELATEPAFDAELAAAAAGSFAVVDEGPGLSGSSFLAVARHLRGLGVADLDIHLFPSHPNPPGPEASTETRATWPRHPRHLHATDDLLFGARAPGGGLAGWVTDLVGEPLEPLQEISGGAWRAFRFPAEAEWPPVHAWQERRKFLCRTATGTWLVRFAGLGRAGLAKLERGRALAAAGFVPEIAGWRHGFLVERWHGEATCPDARGTARAAFLAHLGRYLGFRAATFPAAPGSGASLATLHDMAVYNAGQALGPEAAARLGRHLASLHGLAAHPIATDNRLHGWEWLDAEGRLLKADALDHCTGHDLVGCQDVAWDVAGAIVEFSLAEPEVECLVAAIEAATGRSVDPHLVRLLRPVYLAFQLGYYAMAAASAAEPDRRRLAHRSDAYAAELARSP